MRTTTLLTIFASLFMFSCSFLVRGHYTQGPVTANEMWLEPSFVNITGMNIGYRFNVTVWANLTTTDFTWQVTMNFDPTFLKATRVGYTSGVTSQFFTGHSTIPVTPIITAGTVSIGESLMGTDSRPAGRGSLCWVELELIVPTGGTVLIIDNHDTFFLNSDLEEIVCTKSGASVGEKPVSVSKLTVVSAHGNPIPGVGDSYHASGSIVTCTVSSPVSEGSTFWACNGWSGSGSVPPSGNGAIVTFNITQDSSITWNWTQVYLSVRLESAQNNSATSNLGTITLGLDLTDATPHPAPAVWISPAFFSLAAYSIGDRFSFTVWANTSSPIFTWQITMVFDSTFITCTRTGYTSEVTSQFFEGHNTIPVTPVITRSSVSIGESLIGTDTRPAGRGSLCWVELEVVALTNSTVLGLDNADTFYLAADLNEIASTKYGASIGTNLTGTVKRTYSLSSDVEMMRGDPLYNPETGYLFDHWETSGNITVSDVNANPTAFTVSGLGGTLRAIYASWSPYDVYHDLIVDMKDIGVAGRAFGTVSGDSRWNPQADITGLTSLPDGKVDLRDIGLIARHFQEHYS